MSSKARPSFEAFCLAFVIATGFFSILSSSAADSDDHSYLPPWMLDEAGAVRKNDEKMDRPRASFVREVQPAKAEATQVKTNEPNSTGLADKATQASTKALGFVSNLFRSSVRFARGE